YVLEANTLPGLTSSSLIPKSAMAKGVSFTKLLDKIIEYSLTMNPSIRRKVLRRKWFN
ncbi:MAG TPA: hypothetical protein VHQ24_14000, partial [Lachnospiraceae bacterium]|nr:hypothetical protein [Lachnospiraceae bacterium]